MAERTGEGLGDFIDRSPTPFHAVENIVTELEAAGFVAFDRMVEPMSGKHYVRREGSLIAWVDGRNPRDPIRIISAHTDSPTLRIRPRPDTTSAGIDQLGVEVYGGALLNSWLDRDLGIAGRVTIRDGSELRPVLYRSQGPQLRIPQLAIHLDRSITDQGLLLDRQKHTIPIWSLGGTKTSFRDWLGAELGVDGGDVMGWDLSCFDHQPHSVIGRENEFLCVGRLDDLASCHAGMRALTDLDDDVRVPAVLMLFDHEEVGSATATGAVSAHAAHVLERRAAALGIDRSRWLQTLGGSVMASADMAHATHPNYPDRHEPSHPIALGGGPVIKYNENARYATDGNTAALFKMACEAAGVPWQEYSHRGDIPCGSTIGPLLSSGLGVGTVDVGAPQLSMHSAREMMAISDADHLIAAFRQWYVHDGPAGGSGYRGPTGALG